jgi:hypothetical protein
MVTEPARLASASAAARQATPAAATRRGPKRSASTPAGAPLRNQVSAASENTSAMSPREAPNSFSNAVKKAAKE